MSQEAGVPSWTENGTDSSCAVFVHWSVRQEGLFPGLGESIPIKKLLGATRHEGQCPTSKAGGLIHGIKTSFFYLVSRSSRSTRTEITNFPPQSRSGGCPAGGNEVAGHVQLWTPTSSRYIVISAWVTRVRTDHSFPEQGWAAGFHPTATKHRYKIWSEDELVLTQLCGVTPAPGWRRVSSQQIELVPLRFYSQQSKGRQEEGENKSTEGWEFRQINHQNTPALPGTSPQERISPTLEIQG